MSWSSHGWEYLRRDSFCGNLRVRVWSTPVERCKEHTAERATSYGGAEVIGQVVAGNDVGTNLPQTGEAHALKHGVRHLLTPSASKPASDNLVLGEHVRTSGIGESVVPCQGTIWYGFTRFLRPDNIGHVGAAAPHIGSEIGQTTPGHLTDRQDSSAKSATEQCSRCLGIGKSLLFLLIGQVGVAHNGVPNSTDLSACSCDGTSKPGTKRTTSDSGGQCRGVLPEELAHGSEDLATTQAVKEARALFLTTGTVAQVSVLRFQFLEVFLTSVGPRHLLLRVGEDVSQTIGERTTAPANGVPEDVEGTCLVHSLRVGFLLFYQPLERTIGEELAVDAGLLGKSGNIVATNVLNNLRLSFDGAFTEFLQLRIDALGCISLAICEGTSKLRSYQTLQIGFTFLLGATRYELKLFRHRVEQFGSLAFTPATRGPPHGCKQGTRLAGHVGEPHGLQWGQADIASVVDRHEITPTGRLL